MTQLILHIMRFCFEAVVIFGFNYVMIAGIRDILYFLLPIGPPGKKKYPSISWAEFLKPTVIYRIVFWGLFVLAMLLLFRFFVHFVIFVLVSYFLFTAAERRRLAPGPLVLLTSLLIMAITLFLINSQPVLLMIENHLSVDLWVYNAGNSLIDSMISAGLKLGIDTSGIERLAAVVPVVQKHLVGILYISIYLLSLVVTGSLVKVILPWSKFKLPEFHEIPPVKMFPLVTAACLITAHYMKAPELVFVALAIYYFWGINFLFHLIGGAHWLLFLIAVAAGSLNAVVIPVFIIIGILDNLFDFRRILRMIGVGKAVNTTFTD